MSIKDEYKVLPIVADDYKEWLLKKHYAKRMPQVVYAYGLFDPQYTLCGCVTYGFPPNYVLMLPWKEKYKLLELNRLVVMDGMGKNVLSYFVSQSLKMLPSPIVVISYADKEFGHTGYIYQATNWIYTGTGTTSNVWTHKENPNNQIHNRHMDTKDKSLYEKHQIEGKHRYYYFIGTKNQRKEMKDLLPYPILPYPKGDNQRYDASYEPTVQLTLESLIENTQEEQ